MPHGPGHLAQEPLGKVVKTQISALSLLLPPLAAPGSLGCLHGTMLPRAVENVPFWMETIQTWI